MRTPPNTEAVYRNFTGAYPSIVESLLQPRPDSVPPPLLPPPDAAYLQWKTAPHVTALPGSAPSHRVRVLTILRVVASLIESSSPAPVHHVTRLQVAATGARLLGRLRMYEQATIFQVATTQVAT